MANHEEAQGPEKLLVIDIDINIYILCIIIMFKRLVCNLVFYHEKPSSIDL